ncbi:MAG: HD domain-containing protein [Armatimonadetes bacterium]|nr:HD domain-containing protein [Armatimonadota bacterium]
MSDLAPNARVDSSFAVKSRSLASFRNKPGQYLNLTLADRTGEIPARVWDNAERIAECCAPGSVVRVRGRAEEYQGKLQLIVEAAEEVAPGDVDPADYLPCSRRDPLEMMGEVDAAIAAVTDPHLRSLLAAFFGDTAFRNRFAHAAGAKTLHHAFVSGLLEHTVSVMRVLWTLTESHPELDRDLLTAAALLHDVGKIEELTTGVTIDYTDTGRLLGHTVLTDRMVRERLASLPGFPAPLADTLMHMLLSHHGQKEYGAPIVPMTAEACALHYADNLDAHVQYFSQVVAEGAGSGNRWSDYQRLFDRYIYLGDAGASAPPPGAADE